MSSLNLNYLKNYFVLFIFIYSIILISKFLFLLYLFDNFQSFNISELFYAILWGYKFDFALAAIFTFFSTLFDFNKKIFLFFIAILTTSLWLSQISDIFYFYEASRHTGYEVSDAAGDASGLIMTALSQHLIMSIFAFFTAITLILFLYKSIASTLSPIQINIYYIFKKLFLLLITIFFVRGMTQSIPLNPWQSNQIGDTKLSSLALNGTYNMLYAIANKKKQLTALKLPDLVNSNIQDEVKELYETKHIPYQTQLNKPNVVIYFLESWSGVNMKEYGFTQSDISTTPFYDKIIQQSIRPKAMIAAGHRTTEGIFASLTSYQNPLGKTIAKTQLQDYKYDSLINIFTNNGYESLFFQGTSKETSGTGSLTQSLGFTKSYGKRDIKKRIYEENYWGVQDPDLYNFVIETLEQTTKPFVLGINGATTHDHVIPNEIQSINFVANKNINDRLNALHFSDKALEDFTKKIQKLYPNTVFVFMADHCGGVSGSSFLNYMIPFAIYHKDLKPQYINSYLSQRDFAPSLLDIVLGDYRKYTDNFSGKSLFSDHGFFADYYHNGTLGWIENNNALEINTITNTYKCYDVSKYYDKEINCNNDIIAFRNKVLAFTKVSQKLLFQGKTNQFKEYK